MVLRNVALRCLTIASLCISQSCRNETYYQGRLIYESVCSNCHMDDGSGLKNLIPPLANSDFLKNNTIEISCYIRYGLHKSIVVNGVAYNQPMAGNDFLTDTEITNIINYINHSWENDYGVVSFDEVRKKLKECKAKFIIDEKTRLDSLFREKIENK